MTFIINGMNIEYDERTEFLVQKRMQRGMYQTVKRCANPQEAIQLYETMETSTTQSKRIFATGLSNPIVIETLGKRRSS